MDPQTLKFVELIVPGVVVGIVMLLSQHLIEYLREKRKLISEERWRAKQVAFTQAIRLVDQTLSAQVWQGPGIPADYVPTGVPPNPVDINYAHAQLMLTAASAEIPGRFMNFFIGTSSPGLRAEFINVLRKELFGAKAVLDPKSIPYITSPTVPFVWGEAPQDAAPKQSVNEA